MRLVHDDRVEALELARAPVDGVDGGERHGAVPVLAPETRREDADVRAERAELAHAAAEETGELLCVLFDKLLAVRQHDGAEGRVVRLPAAHGVGHDEALAATGRQHDARVRVARAQEHVERRDRLLLVWPQRQHQNPSCFRSANAEIAAAQNQ